ncbi:MAG: helix-turn-helix domain-containing protein [Acidimicrobiales bacterium]
MAPWSSAGDLLRWWRQDILGWSQTQAAARLSVQPTALSNWENAVRAISLDVDALDRALDGEGVLAGLLWSFKTPVGLDADRTWTKVFTGSSTPVWLWIRSDRRRVRFEGEWGVARIEYDYELGDNGAFLSIGASVSHSPVVIQLSEPGWVDFGRGPLPSRMPDAPVVTAIEVVTPSGSSGSFMDMFFGNLVERFKRSRPQDVANLDRSAPGALARFFSAFDNRRAEQHRPWPPLPTGADEVERLCFARLRRARSLSLLETAERLAALTGVTVSKDTLRRFETDVGQPHDRLLPVALDHVLGAEGKLAIVALRSDAGSGAVRFPPYWHGPIWMSFEIDATTPRAQIEPVVIEFGDWARELSITTPRLLIHHYCAPTVPLRITAPPTVRWTVGIGRRAGAEPIDHGWVPVSVDVAQSALSDTEQALLDALAAASERSSEQSSDEPRSGPGPAAVSRPDPDDPGAEVP